jgi:hypothetical protein
MPKMILRRPFREFELAHESRFEPPAIRHFGGRQSCTSPSRALLRQIRKRAGGNFQRLKFAQQFGSEFRCKAVSRPGGVDKLFSFVVPEHQGIECRAPDRISADHKIPGPD